MFAAAYYVSYKKRTAYPIDDIKGVADDPECRLITYRSVKEHRDGGFEVTEKESAIQVSSLLFKPPEDLPIYNVDYYDALDPQMRVCFDIPGHPIRDSRFFDVNLLPSSLPRQPIVHEVYSRCFVQCDYIDAPFEFDEELEIRLVKSDGSRLHTFASTCTPKFRDNNIWRWEFEDCEYRDRYRDHYFQIQVYGADLEFEIQVIVVHKTFKSMQDWKTFFINEEFFEDDYIADITAKFLDPISLRRKVVIKWIS